MEAGLPTVVAGLAVDVGTTVSVATLPHLEERTEEGLGLAGGHLHAGVGQPCVDHLGPALGFDWAGHELGGLSPVFGSRPGPGQREGNQAGRVGVSSLHTGAGGGGGGGRTR